MAKISEKHKLFCKALLKHKFNQSKAYQEVYPKSKPDTAKSKASLLVTKDNVKEYLEKLKKKLEPKELVTVEEVLNGIKKVLAYCIKENEDGEIDTQGAYKGFELLGKYKAMWTDKVKHEGEVRNVMTFAEAVKEAEKNK